MPKFSVVVLQRITEWAEVAVWAPDEETARATAIEQADQEDAWEYLDVQSVWVDHLKKLED